MGAETHQPIYILNALCLDGIIIKNIVFYSVAQTPVAAKLDEIKHL